MEENRPSSRQSRARGEQNAGERTQAGLEIEASFQKWLTFARNFGRDPETRADGFRSELERVDSIDAEEALLLKLAPEWSAAEFYLAHTAGNPDFTQGSEHIVVRYRADGLARVLKASHPGKFGRYEYTPTIYLNSLNLLDRFAPSLDIRIHGVLAVKNKPSIISSMQYIPGRHPHPRQVEEYLFGLGWVRFEDSSETLDFQHKALRQIIRDAHPLNWVQQRESKVLVPIDISIEQH